MKSNPIIYTHSCTTGCCPILAIASTATKNSSTSIRHEDSSNASTSYFSSPSAEIDAVLASAMQIGSERLRRGDRVLDPHGEDAYSRLHRRLFCSTHTEMRQTVRAQMLKATVFTYAFRAAGVERVLLITGMRGWLGMAMRVIGNEALSFCII